MRAAINQDRIRSKRRTIEAIAQFLEVMQNNMNNNESSHCIFLNPSKAFDTVEHEILLKNWKNLEFDVQISVFCKHTYVKENSFNRKFSTKNESHETLCSSKVRNEMNSYLDFC